MTILVLDDDKIFREAIKTWLGVDFAIVQASSYTEAVGILEKQEIDFAIVDIDLKDPRYDGTDFLAVFKKKYPDRPAIIQSGHKEIATVVKCMKIGADDYLEKPVDKDDLRIRVMKVLAATRKTRVLSRAFEKSSKHQEVIGNNARITEAKQLVERAKELRILFHGETGVGKTPFAWLSNQVVSHLTGQIRPFEHLNCASISNEHFQDQLFGHKKGAFTGAIADKAGLVENASGGDLFLDEIGELKLETQALFLTFMDTMEYYRLGESQKRKADVRIICATNRDLPQMVKEGKFRQDLYSRISQVVVKITPLRDRLDDLPMLFTHFVNLFAGFEKPYDPKIVEVLKDFRWEEGNVRELRDAVEFLCISARSDEKIELHHLSDRYRSATPKKPSAVSNVSVAESDLERLYEYGLEAYLDQQEKEVLHACVKQVRERGTENLESVAGKLGISAATLYRRLKVFGIPLDFDKTT